MVYRVAQESLTNAARHSGAQNVELDLTSQDGGVLLRVADDGHGMPASDVEGAGITGMRERAILVDAELRLGQARAAASAWNCPFLAASRRDHPLKTRIMLADDHAVVRRGLRLILEHEPDLEVVAEVGDGAEAVERALDIDVDLAIVDVAMPRLTGIQAARELRSASPS